MNREFWLDRWRLNQIGFHQAQFNARLLQHWRSVEVPTGASVFVPLCGKSRDMLWLAEQGHPVIGNELAPAAVDAFFAETGLPHTQRRHGAFTFYESAKIDIYCGDFFELTPLELTGVDAVYDRGALVALPPEMRARYADHLVSILPPHAEILLLTLEYDQALVSGPPFSISETEVDALFGSRCSIDVLEATVSDRVPPHFEANGIKEAGESVYRIMKE
ncbi:MAG TPA: thiopurine S-methyltransferase [Pseudomonadales bacterium]